MFISQRASLFSWCRKSRTKVGTGYSLTAPSRVVWKKEMAHSPWWT